MKNPKHWIAKSHAELAAFFEVSIDTIASWASKGMPGKRGSYPMRKITCWLHSFGPRRSDAARDEYLAMLCSTAYHWPEPDESDPSWQEPEGADDAAQ